MSLKDIKVKLPFMNKIKVYAFVGPSGTGKSYRAQMVAGDVLKTLDSIKVLPEVIVLDPPREGVHPKALERIVSYGVENIVYISCKPTSLVNDLKIMQENGYKVERVSMVDMFSFFIISSIFS